MKVAEPVAGHHEGSGEKVGDERKRDEGPEILTNDKRQASRFEVLRTSTGQLDCRLRITLRIRVRTASHIATSSWRRLKVH